MFKKLLCVLAVMFFVVGLSGCATGRKNREMEMQGLRNQISVLEAQVQSKDEEINSLKAELSKPVEAKQETVKMGGKKKVIPEVKSHPKMKQIQLALRNAGYEPGSIDGKAGKQTTEAIKSFQKANNLPVDGKVGKGTWAVLSKYLYQKMK